MTRAEVLRLVKAQWFALARAANGVDLLDKALDASLQVERDHRRFTRNWGGSYALSVEWAARYQVCRIVGERIARPKTWTNVCQYRADFPLCGAIQEYLRSNLKAGAGAAEWLTSARVALYPSKAFKAINYAGDIAKART